jgi:hypothetical protein
MRTRHFYWILIGPSFAVILLEVVLSHETLEGLRLVEALDLAVRDGDDLTVLHCKLNHAKVCNICFVPSSFCSFTIISHNLKKVLKNANKSAIGGTGTYGAPTPKKLMLMGVNLACVKVALDVILTTAMS